MLPCVWRFISKNNWVNIPKNKQVGGEPMNVSQWPLRRLLSKNGAG